MSETKRRPGIGRRRFLLGMLAGTAGLCIYGGVRASRAHERSVPELGDIEGALRPNAYVTVTTDDRIILACDKQEMGQGTSTGYAMLAAEELEVPVERVEIYFPDSSSKFGTMGTGGSGSIVQGFVPIREVAAATRMMLVSAAAQQWGVDASALRAENGSVIDDASGRSARYGELVAVARTLPVPQEPTLKSREQFRVIGTPARRVDNHAKVTGAATFGLDITVPNMAKAAMIHPPRQGATVTSIDSDEAKQQPGVVDVVVTERGVGVVAERYWQAVRAARLVKIEWTAGDMPEFTSESLRAEMAASPRERARNALDEGDVDKAEGALHEAVYEVPYLAHAPMEPLNAIAHITDEGCEIWTGSQGPTGVQDAVALALGLERGAVLVHTPFLGGAFGRRSHPEAVLDAVWLSKAVGRPVQVIWTREDDMRSGRYRPQAWARITGRLDGAGAVTSLTFDTISQSIMAEIGGLLGSLMPNAIPPRMRAWLGRNSARLVGSNAVVADFIATEGATHLGYAIPNRRVTYMPIKAPVSVSWWRSVGFSINTFVVESFLDELAHAAEQDPYQFRRKMLGESPRWLGVLDAVAELSGWGTRELPPGTARGIAVAHAFGSYCAEVIEARIDDGQIKVTKVYAALDCGLALNPDLVESQIEGSVIFGLTAALWGEITVDKGVVQQGNFDDYRMMRMHETPEIVSKLVEGAPEPGGVGEPAVAPLAPALANAIFTLTGERLRRMPLQAEY
ncbi:MAG: xanthine dehydrogenase family protein molybdopterin-binding subunit, partial [Myxococcales bacterium]|nr:xanthine dehydrogenase family protein molybdopterin-binding subunit [Myxococcales bacterium]